MGGELLTCKPLGTCVKIMLDERNSKHPPKVQTSTHAIMPYEFTFSLMEAFISTSSFEIMSFI